MRGDMHTIALALLAALATARGTRLLTRDRILDAPRNRIIRALPRESLLSYLILCDWCTSMYVGTAAAAVGAWSSWWAWEYVPWLALAFSQVAGWLASREGEE